MDFVLVIKREVFFQFCVDCKDLNKAILKDNFSLPIIIDLLVDSIGGHGMLSFMGDFVVYNEKKLFTTLWGVCCLKVTPFWKTPN